MSLARLAEKFVFWTRTDTAIASSVDVEVESVVPVKSGRRGRLWVACPGPHFRPEEREGYCHAVNFSLLGAGEPARVSAGHGLGLRLL